MPKVRVLSFGMSLDGFSAGPRQDLENPLGVNGGDVMGWFFPTNTFVQMHGKGEGEKGIDNEIAERGFDNMGAWILGRNMFGPVRGPWPDESWRGWWGDEPPYHVPAFVLTHHARRPLVMEGGTTFHFVTGGVHEALRLAKEAAGGKDVRVGGGVSTIRQFLSARLIDDLHIPVRPVLLGEGEKLFDGLDMRALGYRVARHVYGERAMHVFIERVSTS
jgi:dihydrofolate reductase